MHLSFLKDIFSEYEIEFILEDDDCEQALIKNKNFPDVLKIYYWPKDYYIYYLSFSTQHYHTSNKNDIIEYALKLAEAKEAAIEFYKGTNNRFGGSISTKSLDNLTYNTLCNECRYGDTIDIDLWFSVRAWNKKYCFNGTFKKNFLGQIQIVKEYIY